MKIVFVAASAVPNNAANSIQVMKTCQAFAQLGHQVSLIVPGTRTAEWSMLKDYYGLKSPFEIIWLPVITRLHSYDLAWKAIRYARKIKADLVYTWMLQAAWMSSQQGLPVMIELHDRVTGQIAPTLFRLVISSRTKKRLLPITQALLNALQLEFKTNFPPGLAIVSPDGVDLERYAGLPAPPAARQLLGLPECPTAVYSGHFYAGRGMGLLFDLAQSNPQINFLWVGGRLADIDMWKQRLQNAGVENVSLPGFIENARLALYQAAGDVLLMPYGRSVSTSSGGNTVDICSPMKMFEYMAAGRAILSSDLPVLHEVLNPSNAVFCPVDEPLIWSKALNALISDASRRATLGRQAQADVTHYTWQIRAQRALEGFV